MPLMSCNQLEIIEHLNNNQNVFLPTASGYILATKSLDNLNKIQQHIHSPSLLMADNRLNDFLANTKLPASSKWLIDVLTPGPIKFSYHGQVLFVPSIPETQNLLDNLNFDLFGTFLKTQYSSHLPATETELAELQVIDKNLPQNYLATQFNMHSIWPTLVDITEPGNLRLKRPGLVNSKEIASILPKGVKLEYAPEYKELSKRLVFIDTVDQISRLENSLIIGSKEKIQTSFKQKVIGSKAFHKIKDFNVLNLGSQSHPENIIRTLSRNLYEGFRREFTSFYLLKQNWGNNHWGELIDFQLRSLIAN